MKTFGLFALILVSLVIESTLLRLPGIAAYAPNLVIIGIVMTSMLRGSSLALLFGLSIGFIQDINFGAFLGETAFAYAVVGYLSGYVRSLLIRESLLLGLLLTGVGTESFLWITFALDHLLGEVVMNAHAMLQLSTQTTLSSMAFMIPLYFIYHRLFMKKRVISYNDDSMQA